MPVSTSNPGRHADPRSKREAGKLGRLPRDHSKAAPVLERYLTDARKLGAVLPNAPAVVDRLSKIKTIPMYGNDTVGDCTVAAMLHMVEALEVYSGRAEDGGLFTEDEAIRIYSAVSGYDPNTGQNDNGATLQQVCEFMVGNGARDKNGKVHKIAAWAEVGDPTNLPLLKKVLNTFGTVYLAIQVPESAMEQFQNGEPWDVVKGSPIEGGHAIPLAYSAAPGGSFGDETIETWGSRQKMTQAFAHAYLDEAVAIVSEDAVAAASGVNPIGLDLTQLVSDCQTRNFR